MSEFNLLSHTLFSVESLDTQLPSLWVFHADKIPPHIGFSVNGSYFSLKAKGVDFALDVSSVVALIQRKEITTLCFQLRDSISKDSTEQIFSRYRQTIPGQITCLQPIKEVLDLPESRILVELLRDLDEHKRIQKTIGFFIPDDFQGIKIYNEAAIHKRLRELDVQGR